MSFYKLPIELIRKILRHATEVSGLLDTSYNPEGPVEEARWLEVQLAVVLPTKQALSLVSKAFNAFVNEFLYEGLVITEFAQISGLVWRLRQEPLHRRSHGWWVRYLAVEFGLSGLPQKALGDLDTLWNLLPSCRNLVILRFVPRYDLSSMPLPGEELRSHLNAPPRLLTNIVSLLRPTLRRLELGRTVRVPASSLLNFLTGMRDVRSLSILGPFYQQHSRVDDTERDTTDHRPENPAQPLRLVSLHTLRLRHFVEEVADLLRLPALRHFGLAPYLAEEEEESWANFVSELPEQLATLEVGLADEFWAASLTNVVGRYLQRLPNVERLILHNPNELEDIVRNTAHSGVTTIIAYDYLNRVWIKHDSDADTQVFGIVRDDHGVEEFRTLQDQRFHRLRNICLLYKPVRSDDVFPVIIWHASPYNKYGITWKVTKLLDVQDVAQGRRPE